MGNKLKKRPVGWYLSRFGSHILLLIASIFIGLPFIWMVTTSIKSPAEVAIFPPIWWPKVIRWDNFAKAWSLAPFGRFYLNSAITASTGVILEVSIAALSAYAFARIRFKYRDVLFIVMLAAMMIPSQIGLIPNYVILKNLRLNHKFCGILLATGFLT
ncbi:MAG: hypothetical protein WC239_09720 [Sphaerochaetaceae bacterium]